MNYLRIVSDSYTISYYYAFANGYHAVLSYLFLKPVNTCRPLSVIEYTSTLRLAAPGIHSHPIPAVSSSYPAKILDRYHSF